MPSTFDAANPVQVERDGDDIVLRVVTELLDETGSVRLNPMQQLSLFQAVDNARRGLLFNYHAVKQGATAQGQAAHP